MSDFSTPWIDGKRGYLSDWLTQLWVKSSRVKINPHYENWLDGPTGEPKIIGESYFEEFATKNKLTIETGSEEGLVEDFSHLNSSQFSSDKVNPRIIDFYENTSRFELDIWSEWSTPAKPFGWLLSKLFSTRIQQLNLPVSALDSSLGITSEIIALKNEMNKTKYVGWLRKVVKTKNVIYAGAYTSCTPPNLGYECVKVVFPLPNGNATVILWPENMDDGSLKLHSSGNEFGDGGFYLLVYSSSDKAYVKYVNAIKETIHVYLDENDELRTDHIFKFWGSTFLQLHYRIREKRFA
ncbi:MAG: hypothetical protein JJ892_07925 [Balneola sp.]|nr:hypothetical protein [Balneola sp.]MBO6651804.1 hypothetical protein [Balneola sp.]MBO6711997.1 hypothetical protein [Balneola sp.]MBO6800193.1 hypothetical protein [Balneola sp.]MBO6871697.1 hypothetical protein [Balneola sp.]